jgi:hypothetical protein
MVLTRLVMVGTEPCLINFVEAKVMTQPHLFVREGIRSEALRYDFRLTEVQLLLRIALNMCQVPL